MNMPTIQYKCPSCGGSLEFDPAKQNFSCEFCLSRFTEDELKAAFPQNEQHPLDKEDEPAASADSEDFTGHTSLYSCPNCGAEIMSEDTTAATFCYYCHGPVILSGRLSGKYRPSRVIPFKHNKESAVESFKKWRAKKWFVPDDFKSGAQLEKITGVYLPFWLADCDVDAAMTAIGKHIRTWTSGDYRYTHTREYEVRRRAELSFRGIPADASSKTDDRLMEAIEPFDYNELRDFSMSYLSGFLAEKFDVEKEDVFPRIRSRADKACEQALRESIVGYTSVHAVEPTTQYDKVDWRYMLLPVWLLIYKHREKNYFFAMNGQTGKMVGIPPLSIPKMLIASGIIGVAAFLITFLGGLLL